MVTISKYKKIRLTGKKSQIKIRRVEKDGVRIADTYKHALLLVTGSLFLGGVFLIASILIAHTRYLWLVSFVCFTSNIILLADLPAPDYSGNTEVYVVLVNAVLAIGCFLVYIGVVIPHNPWLSL